MSELKEMLDLSDLAKTDIQNRFEEIAKLLFQKHQIKKGENIYEFLEIEFYYYTKGHEDVITYPRNSKAGMWFFHNSGVDITFESVCENVNLDIKERTPNHDYFGGILIRRLLKNNGNKVICGPLNCMGELFDTFNALEASKDEIPVLVKKAKHTQTIYKTKRHIPIKEENIIRRFGTNAKLFKDYHSANYRYFIELTTDWDKENLL